MQPIFIFGEGGKVLKLSCRFLNLQLPLKRTENHWHPMLYAHINLSNQLANNLLSPSEKKNTFSHKAVSINDDLNLHDTVYSPLVSEKEAILSTHSRQDHHLVSWAPGWQGLASEVLRNGGIKRSKRERGEGTSLTVEQLRLCASTPGGTDSIPGRGTKIRHAMLCGQKVKEKKRKRRRRSGRTGRLPAVFVPLGCCMFTCLLP